MAMHMLRSTGIIRQSSRYSGYYDYVLDTIAVHQESSAPQPTPVTPPDSTVSEPKLECCMSGCTNWQVLISSHDLYELIMKR